MALNEQIVTGRNFRKCIDVANKLWLRISFWTKASDVEFDDGENAEMKLGAIKGITTDLNITETGYAADMTALAQLNSEIAEPKIGFSSLPGMTLWDSNIQKCILFFPVRYFNMEKYNIVPVRAYISGITSSIDENPRLALGGHYIVAYTNVIDPEYEGHYAILQINILPK